MTQAGKAVLLAVCSAFFFTLESVVAKAVGGVPLATVVLARALGQFVFTAPLLVRDPVKLVTTRHLKLNLLRGALSGVSWFMYFTAFAHLPLAIATVLSFTAVLFVTALAGPILGEKVGWRRWSATLVGFAGVLVILRPGAAAFDPAALVVLAAAMFFSVQITTTKFLTGRNSTLTILFWMNVLQLPAYLATGLALGGEVGYYHRMGADPASLGTGRGLIVWSTGFGF